jgi:hypothetical protein
MDLAKDMKDGPSATQSAWSTRTPSRTRHVRNFVVATSGLFVLIFIYAVLLHTSFKLFGTPLSLLFGSGDNVIDTTSLGDRYILGVGKADITGYEELQLLFEECLLTSL